MRGRLLFPMTVELARLDTNATSLAGGYDADFKTVKTTYPAGVKTSARVELPIVTLKAQVEMGKWQGQQSLQAGNAPDTRLTLVFHFRELEAKGLVDPTTGDALIRVNDRLVNVYSRSGSILEQKVRTAAGSLYATEVQPAGIGLGGRRNLLVVTFDERTQGLSTNP